MRICAAATPSPKVSSPGGSLMVVSMGGGRFRVAAPMNSRRRAGGLYDDLADHHRMQRAVISELARLREGVGKPVAGIQRRGTEDFPVLGDCVRRLVLVDPSDGGARRDR